MAAKTEKQQEMFSKIESWKVSGENQLAFCKSQGIAYGEFHYWYKKYRQTHNVSSGSPGFIPVKLKNEASDTPISALILPDGRRLNFYHHLDASFFQNLLG